MKKHLLVWVLMVCMAAVLFSGCKAKENKESESGAQESTEESMVSVTIDGYGWSGARVEVEFEAGTEESVSWDFEGKPGQTVGAVLDAAGVLDVKPILAGSTFEGWLAFRVVPVKVDGEIVDLSYQLLGETCYSTQELQKLQVPEYDVLYAAKWSGIKAEDYYAEGSMGESDMSAFALQSGDGSMMFENAKGEAFESLTYTYWLAPGQTVKQAADSGQWEKLTLVVQKGADFAGWDVYVGDAMDWGNEGESDDSYQVFPWDPNRVDFAYVLLENCSLYGEKLTTEEMQQIVADGKAYLAIAKWK